MTTASWSTPVDHSNTAGFRQWGSELSTKFAAVGMVQTADTGQINWATVTIPGTNLLAGYEIWKLSSGNLYFKIQYGTNGSVNGPTFFIQTGTGSNGSGTLTGTLSTSANANTANTSPSSPLTNFQSYLCATATYFGLSWKISASAGGPGQALSYITVGQTVDSTGAATSVGFFQVTGGIGGASIVVQYVATAAGVVGGIMNGTFGTFCAIFGQSTGAPLTSQDGSGNDQAYLWWFAVPGATPALPLLHIATILTSDLTLGATATMTLVGTTPHTYIASSRNWAAIGVVQAASLSMLMLYE